MDFGLIVNTLINSLNNQPFTALVNAISVIGFIVTILVYLDVRRIKKAYIFAGRAPDLAKSLKHHSSAFNEYLNDYEGFRPQILEELARAEVTLKSLEKKTGGSLKQSVSHLLNNVKRINHSTPDEDGLRAIYLGMIKVQAEIAELQKDRLWEMSS